MVTPAPRVYPNHVRQTIKGSLPGGEVWSCSLSFTNGGDTAPDPTSLQAFGDACVPFWRAWVINTDTRLSSSVAATTLDTRAITPDGKTSYLAISDVSRQGGAVSVSLPNQCALVVSLITPRAGARYRGRIYVPALAMLVGANGRLQPSQAGPFLAATVTLLKGLNTAAAANLSPTLWSLDVVSGVGAGAATNITSVRVGDVIDTQRRRRDALPENYLVGSLL